MEPTTKVPYVGLIRRATVVGLTVLLVMLQVRLWFGPQSVSVASAFEVRLSEMRRANADLQAQNRQLQAQVVELKSGLATVEAQARSELGMIRSDETFFFLPEAR